MGKDKARKRKKTKGDRAKKRHRKSRALRVRGIGGAKVYPKFAYKHEDLYTGEILPRPSSDVAKDPTIIFDFYIPNGTCWR